MSDKLESIMTHNARTVRQDATIREAAQAMADAEAGAVLVVDEQQQLKGIVTDRDIVVRALAKGKSLDTKVSECCSGQVTTLSGSDTVDRAIDVMREHSVRRVPVLDQQGKMGIVSLGDLARHRDPNSVLGMISRAPANA